MSKLENQNCPICYSAHAEVFDDFDTQDWTVNCVTCGEFRITDRARGALDQLTDGRRSVYLLQGVIRQATAAGTRLYLNTTTVPELISTATPPRDPWQAIDDILLWIQARSTSLAETVSFDSRRDFPIVYAKAPNDFMFLLTQARNLGWLDLPTGDFARLTLNGWSRLAELQKNRRRSDQAFVAMWFTDELKPLWEEGLAPALRDTGYSPIRIDLVQHNERIDDRIIAEIRRSGILVADFTGTRGGVYFRIRIGLGFACDLDVP